MSFYKSAIITSNVINTWDGYLLWRQMRSCDIKVIPEKLKSTVTTEEFQKSQSYRKESSVFSLFEHVKGMIVSNATLLLKLPAKLYYFCSSRNSLQRGSFLHGWLFLVASDVVSTLIDVPFSYYKNFVIEKKHEFNKMSRWEFAKDTMKTFLLRTTLIYPVQCGLIQYVVSKFGVRFPIYFFIASSVILFASMFILPVFIFPLFFVFSPLDDKGELHEKIKALADKIGFPLKKIFIVDGSRRSTHSNAYMYGFWKNKRIVIYDTLLEQLKGDDEQLLSVLCHEFGHWKHGHTHAFFVINLLALLGISYGARYFIFNQSLYSQFGFQEMDPIIGLMLFLEVFVEPVSTLLKYCFSQVSRRFEFEADRFAVSMGYGTKLGEALLITNKANKMELTPDPLYSALIYNHPPLIERLNAIAVEDKKRI
ncbi:unnamed protein product [Phytomonas sp. EM1]|nr:unnamed protein product [Phytomonas sp. EM1]|eukprot:CCW65715.1 unnamed protein product [Phytomonas sp. isolate EM1]